MRTKPSIPRVCEECGVSFLAVASEVRRGHARYCSRACCDAAKRVVTVNCACDACGAQLQRTQRDFALYDKHFCSAACRTAGLSGTTAPRWAGGRLVHPNGYIRVAVPGKGTVYEHRHVWEQAHGPIPDRFHVHHIDGDRGNNALTNLSLLSEADHRRLHVTRNRAGQFGT